MARGGDRSDLSGQCCCRAVASGASGWARHWQLLAQAGLTRGNYKLLCRLLELKVTGQPKVTHVWNSKMRPSVHWAT